MSECRTRKAAGFRNVHKVSWGSINTKVYLVECVYIVICLDWSNICAGEKNVSTFFSQSFRSLFRRCFPLFPSVHFIVIGISMQTSVPNDVAQHEKIAAQHNTHHHDHNSD